MSKHIFNINDKVLVKVDSAYKARHKTGIVIDTAYEGSEFILIRLRKGQECLFWPHELKKLG